MTAVGAVLPTRTLTVATPAVVGAGCRWRG
jgi:hypothetical protein